MVHIKQLNLFKIEINKFNVYINVFFFIGHIRTLPRLIKAPFQYVTYAHRYLDVAKQLTNKPVKQAVITASALSIVYSPHLLKAGAIDNYSREQFLKDLVNECEKDIRLVPFNLCAAFKGGVNCTYDHLHN